jgi:hypothetical protein
MTDRFPHRSELVLNPALATPGFGQGLAHPLLGRHLSVLGDLLNFLQFRVVQEHVKSSSHDIETSRGSSTSQSDGLELLHLTAG